MEGKNLRYNTRNGERLKAELQKNFASRITHLVHLLAVCDGAVSTAGIAYERHTGRCIADLLAGVHILLVHVIEAHTYRVLF